MQRSVNTVPLSAAHYSEKEYAYLLDTFQARGVIAGFTKPILKGMPDTAGDAKKALAFTGRQFGVAYMSQVHGPDIVTVTKPGVYDCDGIFTREKSLALVIKTADCMPILFLSEKEGVIGAVHMGWRSAAAGILDRVEFDLSSFIVFAGVGMRTCCYEVGEEFATYPRVAPYLERRKGSLFFDPMALIRSALAQKGLRDDSLIDAGICSFCSPDGHYSFRRNATADRMLTFIAAL